MSETIYEAGSAAAPGSACLCSPASRPSEASRSGYCPGYSLSMNPASRAAWEGASRWIDHHWSTRSEADWTYPWSRNRNQSNSLRRAPPADHTPTTPPRAVAATPAKVASSRRVAGSSLALRRRTSVQSIYRLDNTSNLAGEYYPQVPFATMVFVLCVRDPVHHELDPSVDGAFLRILRQWRTTQPLNPPRRSPYHRRRLSLRVHRPAPPDPVRAGPGAGKLA